MLPLWSDAETGVQVVRLTEPDEIETLVRLFEGVASEENWQPGEALRLWQDRSVYFALVVEGEIVGGLQLVQPDEATGKLSCQTIWPEVSIRSPRRVAHIAILALHKASRGTPLLFWRLGVEMWRYCVAESITNLFIEVTPRVMPLYQRLGWPLKIEGELRPHWGEDCYLCTLGIPEVAEAILRRSESSPYYREIIAQAFRVTLSIQGVGRADRVKEAVPLYAIW
jgi:hypothetical protein